MSLITEQITDPTDADIAQNLWGAYVIAAARRAQIGLPTVGEVVEYPEGTPRRVSHVWDFLDDPEDREAWVQTSDGGSWYLSEGYSSFSGSLWPGIDYRKFTITTRTKLVPFWFFHRNRRVAGGGVTVRFPVAVWECNERNTQA